MWVLWGDMSVDRGWGGNCMIDNFSQSIGVTVLSRNIYWFFVSGAFTAHSIKIMLLHLKIKKLFLRRQRNNSILSWLSGASKRQVSSDVRFISQLWIKRNVLTDEVEVLILSWHSLRISEVTDCRWSFWQIIQRLLSSYWSTVAQPTGRVKILFGCHIKNWV